MLSVDMVELNSKPASVTSLVSPADVPGENNGMLQYGNMTCEKHFIHYVE
jgi:hypothetical protein